MSPSFLPPILPLPLPMQDICISVGITLALVAGSVPVAVYSGRWVTQSTAVRRPTAAAAVSTA